MNELMSRDFSVRDFSVGAFAKTEAFVKIGGDWG